MAKRLLTKVYEDGDAICDYYDDGTLVEQYPNCNDRPYYGYWRVNDKCEVEYRRLNEDEWYEDKFSLELLNILADKAILEE